MREHTGPPERLFDVRLEHLNGLARVRVSGELDMASQPAFERAISVAEQHGSQGLIVDLSDLAFMDSSGLSALLRARERAEDVERTVSVRGAKGEIQRLLVVSGLHWVFEDAGAPADPEDSVAWERIPFSLDG